MEIPHYSEVLALEPQKNPLMETALKMPETVNEFYEIYKNIKHSDAEKFKQILEDNVHPKYYDVYVEAVKCKIIDDNDSLLKFMTRYHIENGIFLPRKLKCVLNIILEDRNKFETYARRITFEGLSRYESFTPKQQELIVDIIVHQGKTSVEGWTPHMSEYASSTYTLYFINAQTNKIIRQLNDIEYHLERRRCVVM